MVYCLGLAGMDKERSLTQALALYSQLGLSVAIPLGVFTFLGHWGDQKMGTGPVLLLVGLAVGAITTFYTLYRMLKDATS
jgi:F0F1-type ATP synthase assembly protein I